MSKVSDCGECGAAEPVVLCKECNTRYCSACEGIIHRRALSWHTRVPRESALFATPTRCELHDQQLRFYCTNHKQFVCRECLTLGHAGHQCTSIISESEEAKEYLATKEHTFYVMMGETRQKVLQSDREVCDKIEHLFRRLLAVLYQRKAQFIEENKSRIDVGLQQLDAISEEWRHLDVSQVIAFESPTHLLNAKLKVQEMEDKLQEIENRCNSNHSLLQVLHQLDQILF